MIFAYTRVSTNKQTSNSQIDDLKNFGFDELFEDKISGKDFHRPAFDKMMEKLRKDDVVVVWRLDRLGRSLLNVLQIIELFRKNEIHLLSIKDGIDTRNSTGKLLIGFLATLAEYEHVLLNERRLAGIQEARRRGVQLGRRPGLSEKAKETAKMAKTLYNNPDFTVKEIIKQLNISRKTFYNYLQYKEEK